MKELSRDKKSLNKNISFLLEILADVRKETEQNQKEKVSIWAEYFSNWIDIWRYFDNCLGREKLLNSCLGFRLFQLNKELIWLWLECTSGIYDSAIRNLRYILESFLQAYYVDKEHPNANMECKLEILKEIDKLVGRRLIENLELDGKYKKQIRFLYDDLCKFAHPSFKEWQKIIEEGKINSKVTFRYDKDSFEECIKFTDRVMDIIVFLLMNFCEEMINKIREDKIFLELINNIKNSLIIQYLQNFNKKKNGK